jgi:hypothetical protein
MADARVRPVSNPAQEIEKEETMTGNKRLLKERLWSVGIKEREGNNICKNMEVISKRSSQEDHQYLEFEEGLMALVHVEISPASFRCSAEGSRGFNN